MPLPSYKMAGAQAGVAGVVCQQYGEKQNCQGELRAVGWGLRALAHPSVLLDAHTTGAGVGVVSWEPALVRGESVPDPAQSTGMSCSSSYNI